MDAKPSVLDDKDMAGVWTEGESSTKGNQSSGSEDLKFKPIWKGFIHLFLVFSEFLSQFLSGHLRHNFFRQSL